MNNSLLRNVFTEAGPDNEGKRLDVWLGERFTYHSRNAWQNLIKTGGILLNGKKSRCSAKLRKGDKISFIPDKAEPLVDLNYSIVFEDEYFMVVNKSGNLPCHPAGPFFQNTLWFQLFARDDGKHKIFLVGRLDRETSGLVIVAKDSVTAAKFADMMNSRMLFRKKYIAIVFGVFPESIHAKGFLIPDVSSEIRKKRRFIQENEFKGNNEEAEFSETFLKRLDGNDRFSIVEAELVTGRMHQIRATLFSLGFPLLGDKIYGADETAYIRFIHDQMTDGDFEKLGMARQALHSASLEFHHPVSGKLMSFTSPLPEDMKKIIVSC